ncbi:MAG: protein translocase subunit SecDF, partial [Chitinophagaceae bacterium]|nr:protein translocase subunit SecDF [Chitinophagaceae bacterium]
MRALVSIFAALLILISLYQLSFTWFVNKHEKSMKERALTQTKKAFPSAQLINKKGHVSSNDQAAETYYSERLARLLDSTKDTKITWWGQTYQKAKESELLLGLDLQGGINVTLDVALDGLIKGLANNPKDPALQKAIAEAQRRKLKSDENFIDLFVASYEAQNPGAKLAPLFANATRNKLSVSASNQAVLDHIRSQANAAMQQTFQVLTKRIDKFGVAQPNISLDENKGIITVELAGATDPERVRRYLQSTANLQFFEVYTLNDQAMVTSLENANKALQTYLYGSDGKDGADSTTAKPDSLVNDSARKASQASPLFQVLYPNVDPQTGKP